MIFLYSFLLFSLRAIKAVIDRRVASLARRYFKTAQAVEAILREPLFKSGNTSKPDTCHYAKRQYLLGELVQKRDRLEEKHDAWQGKAAKFGGFLTRVRGWKGRKLPYTLGMVDVWFLMALGDYLGVGEYTSLRHLVQVVQTLISR